MADWLQEKIIRLAEVDSAEDRENVLAEIKGKLTYRDEVNRDLIDRICEILKIILNRSEHNHAICEKYSTDMLQLLTHANRKVRSLILNIILSMVSSSSDGRITTVVDILLQYTTLLADIVHRIADEDLGVAKNAMEIIKKLGTTKSESEVKQISDQLKISCKFLVKDEIIFFRIYEVAVDIAMHSESCLEVVAGSGLLDDLFLLWETDDILVQAQTLEILTDLAGTKHGINYLEQRGVLSKLVQKVAESNDNPLSHLLVPGLMKFFGEIASRWPNEMFSKYPIILAALFKEIENGDQVILGVALDTLGHVAWTIEGKYALQAVGDAMNCALKRIAEIIQKMPTALRIRGLTNLAKIIDANDTNDERILTLTKSWFDALCDEPMGMIVAISRQPFEDISEAGLTVLLKLSLQPWGQIYISVFPGLVEFLLDRNIEICKKIKYEIVKSLSQAKPNTFDATMMQRLKEYVNQGPYYIEMNTEVATEGM